MSSRIIAFYLDQSFDRVCFVDNGIVDRTPARSPKSTIVTPSGTRRRMKVLSRVGLRYRVTLVRIEHSSYA